MKKIELNVSKLKLQKEKIADLSEPKSQKNAAAAIPELPTTTVWDHTKIILC
jgi:hypothetical protein